MAAVMNGMALHGGVIPACGTFFVFSDYMKPAVRLACLMELPVKYIWTHDAFRVGEDGPTHQPVEQEAQIRLMEQLKNHSGSNSMLVLRPADAAETTVSWKLRLKTKTHLQLFCCRDKNISDLPAESGSRYNEALKAGKALMLSPIAVEHPMLILLASGSEVATLVEGAELLKKDGLKTRIVCAIRRSLQKSIHGIRDSVIPSDVPVFGLTAGLPVTLQGLAGPNGRVWGVTSFGYSAPYKILDEKLGFTAANVYKQVKDFLDSFK